MPMPWWRWKPFGFAGDHCNAYSAWQRDAVHPLHVLPYGDTGTSNIAITLEQVDLATPMQPQVTVAVTLPHEAELDLQRVEVRASARQEDGAWSPIAQPGETPSGLTPEGAGDYVQPPWFDMDQWNRQYSYKDSGRYPWASFGPGGAYASPYGSDLPGTYDPNVHLDQPSPPPSISIGSFNGVTIAPSPF